MRVVQTKFPRGKVVRERYSVEELLGQGGFGAVYRVRDRRVRGNVFALKEVVDPNIHQRESFAFEYDILRRLDHHALPRVYRVFEDHKNNCAYMLMDYIEGPNLERLRKQQPEQRFSLAQVTHLMTPIIEAVIYLHAQQPPIIHRDIKPSNIIVPISGDAAVLVDFGIAKEYDQDSTTTAIRHCSPGYGAPEQYVRGTSTQTDIYGLGATFYTLLTGEVPIDALYRITRLSGRGVDPLELANERVPAIPCQVARAIQRAMEVNSNDRFSTVEEFWQELRTAPLDVPDTEPVNFLLLDPITEQATLDYPLVQGAVMELLSSPASAPDTPLGLAPVRPLVRQVHRQQVKHVWRKRYWLLSLMALMMIALSMGAAFSVRVWPANLHHAKPPHLPVMVTTVGVKVPGSVPTPLINHMGGETSVPPAPPTPFISVPTPTPWSYPMLKEDYRGTIHNTPAAVDATMMLSMLKQDNGVISGYFAVGPNLIGSGNFTGTITFDNQIQFLVGPYNRLLPLLFTGHIQVDGGITGTYCSSQNGRCRYSGGGYGSWAAFP